jgi:NAD(P)-dependent dehydrogenase (short-subunit alcohol dehydrogenase family)
MKDREDGRRRCLVGLGEATGPRSGHGREFESRDGGPTRTLAAEGGPHGVTADAVCPGLGRGPRVEAGIENHAAGTDRSPEEVKREKVDDTLGASFVESTDVGSLVAYLCSDAASSVTKQAINISEGKVIH